MAKNKNLNRILASNVQTWLPGVVKTSGYEKILIRAVYRNEKKGRSLSVDLQKGLYYDFGLQQGGDLIQLFQVIHNVSYPEIKKKYNLYTAKKDITPAPVAAKEKPVWQAATQADIQKLYNSNRDSELISEYYLESGELAFCVIRRKQTNQQKRIRPVFLSTDFKWVAGMPVEFAGCRPLYNLLNIKKNISDIILVVEGEKCATVKINGYMLTTWHGGAAAVNRTDWSSLKNKKVIIWPDNDLPGIKAANEIKDNISGIADSVDILKVEQLNKAAGYDIADAVEENENIQALIERLKG